MLTKFSDLFEKRMEMLNVISRSQIVFDDLVAHDPELLEKLMKYFIQQNIGAFGFTIPEWRVLEKFYNKALLEKERIEEIEEARRSEQEFEEIEHQRLRALAR